MAPAGELKAFTALLAGLLVACDQNVSVAVGFEVEEPL